MDDTIRPSMLSFTEGFSSMSSSSLVLLLSTFVFLLIAARSLRRHPKAKAVPLPPSPPRLPLIGNLHQLSALPHRPLRDLSKKFGPVMLLHIGQIPTVVVSSVATAQEVLKDQDLAFATRPFSAAGAAFTYGSRNVSFAPYGAHWRQAKKACVVHLLNSGKVQSLRRTREEEVARMVQKISSSSTPAPATVNLSEILYGFSSGVICRAVAGDCVEREERSRRFREIIDEATAIIGGPRVEELFPSLAWISRLPGANSRLKKLEKKRDALLDEIMAEHERRARKQREDPGGKEELDFIDLLLMSGDFDGNSGFSTIDVKAIFMDLIAAGTDTSYVVLEWAMSELVKNPALMEKTQTEVRAAAAGKSAAEEDDLPRMPLLRAVVKEVLRLHMPAPLLLPREAMADASIQGYDVPAGSHVFINAWAMATDEEWWESPEEFRPERFLPAPEKTTAAEVDPRGNDMQFLPFGAGRRSCPGMGFALCEVELALAGLLYHFDWAMPGGEAPENLDMAEAPGITVRRKTPLLLVALPRHRSAI